MSFCLCQLDNVSCRGIIEGKDDYIHMRDVMTGLNEKILAEAIGPDKLRMVFWGGGDIISVFND